LPEGQNLWCHIISSSGPPVDPTII
jgi:hypothetical protein